MHSNMSRKTKGSFLLRQVDPSYCRCFSSEPHAFLVLQSLNALTGCFPGSGSGRRVTDLKQTYTTHKVKTQPLYAPLWRINAEYWQCYLKRMYKKERGIIQCWCFSCVCHWSKKGLGAEGDEEKVFQA
ncbi:hypothetical protein PAMP_018688 [Pampus punctatissimus]